MATQSPKTTKPEHHMTSVPVSFRRKDFHIVETSDGFDISLPVETIDIEAIVDVMRDQGFTTEEAHRALNFAHTHRVLRLIGERTGLL